MSFKTIDIIGANGYIGKGFTDFLDSKGIHYRKVTRIQRLLQKEMSFRDWSSTCSENICIYLADPAFLREDDYDLYESAIKRFDKAIECTRNLFVYISSSKVYLDKSKGTYSENDAKSSILLYQKLKNRNEDKLISFLNKKYLILRIPSYVDKEPKPNTLFNKIVNSNKTGNLQLSNDYSFSHEFLFSSDFFKIILQLIKIKKISNEIFNISSSKRVNIMDLLNPNFRYISCPKPYTLLDNRKLLSYVKINFKIPKYSIEDNSIYWV